jgi:hypothetical protein
MAPRGLSSGQAPRAPTPIVLPVPFTGAPWAVKNWLQRTKNAPQVSTRSSG